MTQNEFVRKAYNGLNLYFQSWNSVTNQKGVICLVHGLGEHSGRYSQWAARFTDAGYSVISYDLRGHGKSEGLRGHISSYNDYVEDTKLLIDEARNLFPGIPVFLYGHSLGAIIAWYYVLRIKPELNGVILTALDYRNALEEQKGKVLLSKVLGSVLPKLSIESGLVPEDISRDPEVVKDYINDPLVHSKLTLGFAKSSLEAVAWALKHTSEWNLPVLVLHGEEDKLGYTVGSREFASVVDCDCTLKIWPGLSHEIHNEPEKEMVFEFIETWLDNRTVAKKAGLTGQS